MGVWFRGYLRMFFGEFGESFVTGANICAMMISAMQHVSNFAMVIRINIDFVRMLVVFCSHVFFCNDDCIVEKNIKGKLRMKTIIFM